MPHTSELNSHLKDALQNTKAAWAAVARREGGKWSLSVARGLGKQMQASLMEFLHQSEVDAWLCGAMNGSSSRSATLPPESGLKAERLYVFPVSGLSQLVLVGAGQQSANDQRVWRLFASLLARRPAPSLLQSFIPDFSSGLPYDLPLALDRLLMAFVRAVNCQGAWLAISRGDALEVRAEWNSRALKGQSFFIQESELLWRVQRTLADVATVYGEAEWDEVSRLAALKRGTRVWVCVPLVMGQRLIGAVSLWRQSGLDGEEWQRLRDLAMYLSPYVEVIATFLEVTNHLRRLAMLNDFALTVSSANNLDQIIRRGFDLLARAFNTELISLYLLSMDGRMIREYKTVDRRFITQNVTIEGHPAVSLLRRARLMRLNDSNDKEFLPLRENVHSALVVPLRYRGQPIGVVMLESLHPDAFSLYDEQLMGLIASHLAGLVEYGRLREEAESRARNLGLIHEVVQQVIGLTDKREVAQITADLLAQYFAYELAAVLFLDENQQPTIQGFGGTQAELVRRTLAGRPFSMQSGLTGYVFSTGRSMLVNDTSQEPLYHPLPSWNAAAEMCVALKDGEHVLGIIDVESSHVNAFTHNDLVAIESLAGILAAVASSADQYQRLQTTVRELRLTQVELKSRMEAQRAAESRLLQAAKMAAVGEMAATIAHELNNPLTTVTGFAELILSDAEASAPYRTEMEMILREARRASDVVRRLLDFSRQGEGTRTPTDMNAVVDDVVALSRHLIHTSNVNLTLNLAQDLPWVAVDRNQMKQVLLNLIHNALQAMPKGGELTITTAVRPRDQRSWFTLSVQDSGMGIKPEDLERIFEPFFTTKGERGGTGLGLSITYGIVTEHGGTIEVKSEPGKGSLFTVWLPL
jgi:signal transduction histidine kinase